MSEYMKGSTRFGFALRQHEKRLQVIETMLGIARAENPLNSNIRPEAETTKEEKTDDQGSRS